ncbi:uncharacterized protein LOC129959317 [Argiope bruennichi]|uniref:uncharacterized protein LOC129959317 n=1 Tax=Argiope bruennichi TaxID=94029 RepID=UPI002494A2BA|nr:uncharacterized protein LOC129959317 [Argiope bruennichi]
MKMFSNSSLEKYKVMLHQLSPPFISETFQKQTFGRALSVNNWIGFTDFIRNFASIANQLECSMFIVSCCRTRAKQFDLFKETLLLWTIIIYQLCRLIDLPRAFSETTNPKKLPSLTSRKFTNGLDSDYS